MLVSYTILSPDGELLISLLIWYPVKRQNKLSEVSAVYGFSFYVCSNNAAFHKHPQSFLYYKRHSLAL